jgi:hypothetical protein
MDSRHSQHYVLGLMYGSALTLALSGCAMEEIPESSPDFGDSVRHTIALQTGGYGRPTGMDATKAERSLRVYQQDVGQPKKVEQELILRVGQ